MDDNNNNKLEDANANPKDTSGITDQNKVAKKEPGEEEESNMWASWKSPQTLRGTGLKEHEEPVLTDKQRKSMNAPVNDFTARLENAVRGKATKSIKIGEFDD